ncbi:MAG: Rpn family recombination-promoting nuclease/putative transposase [Oscillospiraceae bacterium]|nr:Rpn family recombination-promoting nuclease/putative transposase [Oscillospiraceae bacterium]
MCLMHDSFMSAVLQYNECCEVVINTILDRDDITVIESRSQHTVTNLHGRSVRLDVFAKDSTDKLYNIEIQRDNAGAVPQRARYNSSLIDAGILNAGDKFGKLPETYVIFITEKDMYNKGLPLYTVSRVIMETNENFNDGSHIIYVNSEIQDDTKLGKLMSDFHCTDPDDMHSRILAERVDYLKNNKEGNTIMCKIVEEIVDEMRDEMIEEIRKEIINEKAIDIAKNMISKGTYTAEEISELTDLPLEEIKKLMEGNSANP